MANDLKPSKHRNGDLFVCDITDVILKDDLATMEHPFYSLSKKPDRETRRYEHNGNWIEFRPSVKGLPTIYDKDLIDRDFYYNIHPTRRRVIVATMRGHRRWGSPARMDRN